MLSAGGGENGDGCGAVTAGIAVGGPTVTTGLDPTAGFDTAEGTPPSGAGRAGTCIGTEPIPICTEGAVAGGLVAPRRGAAGAIAIGGGVTGPSIAGATGDIPPGADDIGIMAGASTSRCSGSGGIAVLAVAIGWLTGGWPIGSGGGVGGKLLTGGAAGFGAGAAAPA